MSNMSDTSQIKINKILRQWRPSRVRGEGKVMWSPQIHLGGRSPVHGLSERSHFHRVRQTRVGSVWGTLMSALKSKTFLKKCYTPKPCIYLQFRLHRCVQHDEMNKTRSHLDMFRRLFLFFSFNAVVCVYKFFAIFWCLSYT
jgi:hypothetical protein